VYANQKYEALRAIMNKTREATAIYNTGTRKSHESARITTVTQLHYNQLIQCDMHAGIMCQRK